MRNANFMTTAVTSGKNKSSQLNFGNLAIFQDKVASLPRLVTPAKVHEMAAQLHCMFRTPLVFASAKIQFLTVGSRRNGHPQIKPFQECGCSEGMSCTDNLVDLQHGRKVHGSNRHGLIISLST